MKKERESNIELSRMLAMLMILIIHANMVSISRPTTSELLSMPIQTITRYFIESLGIVGVNIFVLISGWFTIKTRAKSFLSFAFQIIYILAGVVVAFLITGLAELNIDSILDVFCFTRREWFIKAYIVLMIIAPILNTFFDNSSLKQQRNVIVGFFLFSSTYGWLGGANRFFVYGYGPLLFFGLYLLGHFVHTLSQKEKQLLGIAQIITLNKYYDLLIYIVCTIINTVLGIYFLYKGWVDGFSRIYAYTNPFTIVGALYLLLFFSKLKIPTNKIINVLASGSFAVYLLHSNILIFPYFTFGVQSLFVKYNGGICLLTILIYIILVYVASVIVDFPRAIIWKQISNKFNIR